ncbi:MAG: alanine racemase [Bacteroidales bacterium]
MQTITQQQIMSGTSLIEISESAVTGNIRFLQKQFGDSVLISSVVKSNAYGHGIHCFVPIAEKAGIKHFSVFSVAEAKEVMKVKRSETVIMVMGWMDDQDLGWAVENQIEFFVSDIARMEKALEIAAAKPAIIHVEIETGMNRTGMTVKELKKVCSIIYHNPGRFKLKGLCTHLAGAESIANHVRIQNQLALFLKYCRWMEQRGMVPEYKHVASSAAAIAYPETRFNMVRIGILQYGYWPSAETFIHCISKRDEKADPLTRVISWKSRVMSVKKVKRGEFVSYGTNYLATEDKKIAIVPVGYSHGYSRSLSNLGRVLINGKRVGVIASVNMNMLIADITKLAKVKAGDEVVLIGSQGELAISVASFSEFSNQLNYELLTRLPEGTPRQVVT